MVGGPKAANKRKRKPILSRIVQQNSIRSWFFLWVLDLKYMHVVSSAYMRATFKERAHAMRPEQRL